MGPFLRSSFLKNNGIILYILHITKVNGAENIQVVMTIIQVVRSSLYFSTDNSWTVSKLTPIQKTQIIMLLQELQNTVGFLGGGINDAAALRQSDIGISVDSAVDIAK